MNFNELIKDTNTVMWFMVGLGATFLFTGVGAFISELYALYLAKSRRISGLRAFISTISGGFIALLIGDNISHISPIKYFAMCFVLGLVGFELTMKITRLNFWIDLLKKLKK